MSPDMLSVVSTEGCFLQLNPAWESSLGYSTEELMGKPFLDFVHPDDVESTLNEFRKELEGSETINFVSRFRCRDGSYKLLEWRGKLSDDKKQVFSIARDISDRIETKEMLFEREEKFRQIFENVQDVYLHADQDGIIVEVSPSVKRFFHYTREELMGTSVEKLYARPDQRKALLKALAEKGEVMNHETLMMNKEGEVFWVSINAHFQYDKNGKLSGIDGTIRDISELKNAVEAVKRDRILLRTLIDNLPDTIYIKDIEGKKIIANNADWTLMGFSSEAEVIGKTDLEVFSNEIGMRGYKDDMAVLRNEQPVINHEEDFIDPNGNQCWLYTTKMPLRDEDGNTIGLVGIGRNITERKKARLQLEKQANELKELNATKDKFFSIIAHDLKNPFHAILGYSNILIEDFRRLDQEDIEQMLKVLVKQSTLAYNLLENLLLWARSQTGRLEIKPEKIDLFSMILDNLSLLKGQAGKKNLQLVPNINDPLEGFADAKMVDTVLRNLLSNASKFTPVNGKIVVSAVRLNDEIEISIRDTGVGIPEKNLENIFKLDSKTNTLGTENEAGTGLGLILCKEFVEKNGGKIWAESEVGKGSTFRFTVPG